MQSTNPELETARQHLQGLLTDQAHPHLLNDQEASLCEKIEQGYSEIAKLESRLAAVRKRRMTLSEEIGKAKANITALQTTHVARVETAKKAPVIEKVSGLLEKLSPEELHAVLLRCKELEGATS